MQNPGKSATQLLEALPREFDFYHLGKVRLQEAALAIELDDYAATFPRVAEDSPPAVGFSFRGDVSGILVINVPGGSDPAVYAEMGNVIASMVATRLSNERQLDVMISSPSFLSSAALRKLAAGSGPLEGRTYLHHHESAAIPVSAWIVAGAERIEHV